MFNRNKFIISKVIKKDDFITYEYEVKGNFKKYFWLGELFNIKYENINIESVPDSIAVIPLVANILPIIWVNDAILCIDEIDEDFYNCIDTIKESYKKMIPMCKFKGKIKVKKIIKNKLTNSNKSLCFFTGGIDSYSTYINIKSKKPDLITVWGADIDYENEEGFKNVKKYVNGIGKSEHVNNYYVRASIRRFIDNSELENTYFKIINDDWWHAMQHGIGIISLSAPLSYVNNYKTIYFASTYTEEDRKSHNITCASVPEIDENFTYSGVKVIHEGYELDRMHKVINICKYSKKEKRNILLHVCYRSKVGDNCCRCEKCYRTICEILSEGENPNKYGLTYNDKIKKEMVDYINNNSFSEKVLKLWIGIVNNLDSKKKLNSFQKELLFIKNIKQFSQHN